jgi:hypothetical protein
MTDNTLTPVTYEPVDEFIAMLVEAGNLLDEIHGQIDDHLGLAPDDVTHAHVGRFSLHLRTLRTLHAHIHQGL